MRKLVSQEAMLSLEKDEKTVLRFPENRKWDSEYCQNFSRSKRQSH